MKTTAKAKKVRINGMDLLYYRFKIFYKTYKGIDKVIVRWASNADNAILSLVEQYGWTVAEHPMLYAEDDHGKALVRMWVPEKEQNYFIWMEAYQNDY